MNGRGIQPGGARIEWADLMAFKRTITDPVPEGHEQWLRHLGIDTFHGRATFVGRTTVRVGDDHLKGNQVVIASGAMPAKLMIPGEEHLITSTKFLDLDELPDRVVFVGGGYISMEFATWLFGPAPRSRSCTAGRAPWRASILTSPIRSRLRRATAVST